MATSPDDDTRKAWKVESQSIFGKMRVWLVLGHVAGLVILFGAITQGAVSLNLLSQGLGLLFIIGATSACFANYFTALAFRGWGTANYDIGNRMAGHSEVFFYTAATLLLIGMTAPLFLPILNTPGKAAEFGLSDSAQPSAASQSANEEASSASPAASAPVSVVTPPAAPTPAIGTPPEPRSSSDEASQ
jgi:hypothetical protein